PSPNARDDSPDRQRAAAPKAGAAQPAPRPPAVEDDPVRQQVKSMQGDWLGMHMDFQGEKQGIQPSLSISGNTIQRRWDGVRRKNQFQFAVSDQPLSWTFTLPGGNAIALTCVDGANQGTVYPGIYKFDATPQGPRLTLAFDLLGKRRPASFINDGASTCVAI